MSLYSYDDAASGQSPKRPETRSQRSLFPAVSSTSKLFGALSDDPDPASSMSDLENTHPATHMLSASTTAFTRPTTLNANSRRESVEMADVSPAAGERTATEKTAALPADAERPQEMSRYQELTSALRSYQAEQQQADSSTPACKLPPHPVQGSTVTSRWRRRGRLGLGKPKRADPSLPDENVHSEHTGFTDELMPKPIDFASGLAGLTSAGRPGSSAFSGSVDSDMSRSARSSFLSVDGLGDHDSVISARLRGKNSSMASIASESLSSFPKQQQHAYVANRSMDASDVSMNSEPRSRESSPARVVGSNPSGMSPGLMGADEINAAGKRLAAARDSDGTRGLDVQPGGDSVRRRAVSPTGRSPMEKTEKWNVPGALSPRLARASPGSPAFTQRSVVSAGFSDKRPTSPDMPADPGPAHYRSPRERPRLLASFASRTTNAAQAAGPKDDPADGVNDVPAQQHAMSEPKPLRHGSAKLPVMSSSARAAERFVPSAGTSAHDARPEYLGAGRMSPRLAFARKPEGGFEPLGKSSPAAEAAAVLQKGTDERGGAAMGLPSVEDKTVLQKGYLAAVALQQQHARKPIIEPAVEPVIEKNQQDAHQSQHQHQHQYQHHHHQLQPQQLHTPQSQQPQPQPEPQQQSQPQTQAQLQPQIQNQIQTQSQSQAQQQVQTQPQQPAVRNGMDPKRTLVVNGRAYQKISITGRGGSSKVYKAMSAKHEIFAIKRVSFSRADVQTIEGYVNEIMLLRRFEGNPYIIQLFDAEITKERGLLHMVMEFGETDLANVLKRLGDRPLGMNMVRLYWEQMLRAVQTIHEARVVHADLKPANYLLVRGSLKLIDFGIAKAIGNDTTNIHRENQVGTVNYMSPEAIKETSMDGGKRLMKLGRASDIWSLGIILYQMCYGRTPFAQLALFQKLASIPDPNVPILFPQYMAGCLQVGTDRDPNLDPSPRYPDGSEKTLVPPDLMRVMKYCLQRDPEKRMTIPDLLVDMFLCPMSLEQALPSAMSQMLSLLKKNPQVLDQWDVSEEQNEKMLAYLTRTLGMQEQGKQA